MRTTNPNLANEGRKSPLTHTSDKPVGAHGAGLPKQSSAFNFDRGLTRGQRREIERRKRIVETFYALLEKGMSKEAAALEVGSSVTTLWRWHANGLTPQTSRCGRKTLLAQLNPPAAILARVRKLQLTGKTNSEAWKAIADYPDCPSKLADYLNSTWNISPSLLAATRLTRRKATVIEGPEFSVIQKPNQPCNS